MCIDMVKEGAAPLNWEVIVKPWKFPPLGN